VDKLTIDFTPKDTVSHLLEIIKINIESLNYGLRLLESKSELSDRLEKDDDFFHIQIGTPLSENEIKNNLRKILLQKSFEDLLKGVTLSLCDAYLLINFRLFLCNEKVITINKINDAKKNFYKKAHGKSLPNLINEISSIIEENLPYSNELLSINQTRNCLIHRKGIVYPEKDINDRERNVLVTKWLRYALFESNTNKEIEIVKNFVITQESSALVKTINQERIFKPYEIVTFNYKEILEISYTCYLFANGLVNSQIKYLQKNPIKKRCIQR